MYNRNPNDVAQERTDAAEPYDETRERVARSEAELREADDPVSGARPPTDPVDPVSDETEDDDVDGDRR
jgi:hypothetical protein